MLPSEECLLGCLLFEYGLALLPFMTLLIMISLYNEGTKVDNRFCSRQWNSFSLKVVKAKKEVTGLSATLDDVAMPQQK